MIRSLHNFEVLMSTRLVLDRTCLLLVLLIPPCAPRSAHASPLTNQRGACTEKYDFYHFAVSQRIPGIYTYVQLLQQLKDEHLLNIFVKLSDLITRFTGSLFPQLLRHLQNCSYQRHLQIEKTDRDGSLSRAFLHDLFQPSINMLHFLLLVTRILYLNVLNTDFFQSQTGRNTFTLAGNRIQMYTLEIKGPPNHFHLKCYWIIIPSVLHLHTYHIS